MTEPDQPRTWTVSTEDVMRGLPYLSPTPGWHAHGVHLVPSDGCQPCIELRRRAEAALSPTDVPAEAYTDDKAAPTAAVEGDNRGLPDC